MAHAEMVWHKHCPFRCVRILCSKGGKRVALNSDLYTEPAQTQIRVEPEETIDTRKRR